MLSTSVNSSSLIRVVTVDDHQIFLDGLSRLFQLEERCVGRRSFPKCSHFCRNSFEPLGFTQTNRLKESYILYGFNYLSFRSVKAMWGIPFS